MRIMIQNILAAVDFSNATRGVMDAALEMAEKFGAGLHVVHVIEPEPLYTAYGFTPDEFPAMQGFQIEARKRTLARLEGMVADGAARGVTVTTRMLEGGPLSAIQQAATECGAGLVVLGSHGHGAVAALLLGSVAAGFVRKAEVPVLVVPAVARETA